MPCLFVIVGPDEGLLYPLDTEKPTTIGRGDDAVLQLVDERASRIHCKVEPTSGVSNDFGLSVTQWIVSDAGSSNGTRIGTEVIEGQCTLADGDTILLGKSAIVYLQESLTDAGAARTRCEELNIQISDEVMGMPLSSPAQERTLQDG